MKDFYYILGTRRDAPTSEIEAAYEKLSRKFYDDADQFMDAHFQEIAEAYYTLHDERRRRMYDAAFRKSESMQRSNFRLSYLNIALTLIFLLLTAIFALYVIRTLQGHPAGKTAALQAPPKEVAAVPTHTKKRRKTVRFGPLPGMAQVPAPTATASASKPAATARPQSRPPEQADTLPRITLHANITGIIYLHEHPVIGSAVLDKIQDGTQVELLHAGQGWDEIRYEGKLGYVLKSAAE